MKNEKNYWNGFMFKSYFRLLWRCFAAVYDGDKAADYAKSGHCHVIVAIIHIALTVLILPHMLKSRRIAYRFYWKGAKKRGDNTRAWINCEAQKLYLANMERGFQVKSYKKLKMHRRQPVM